MEHAKGEIRLKFSAKSAEIYLVHFIQIKMKNLIVLLLILSLIVSGCNLNVQILTPITLAPTPISTQSPLPTMPLIPGDFGWGKIHGKVTDAATGALIVGATVTCEHLSHSSPSPCSGTTTTDEDGIYVFENVYFHDTDSIRLKIQAASYQTHEITLAVSSFAMPNMEVNVKLIHMP